MKYKNASPHIRKPEPEGNYVALIDTFWKRLDYRYVSEGYPGTLLDIRVSLQVHEETPDCQIIQEGQTFFLVDRSCGEIKECWTAVHRSALPFWEEVLGNE